VKVHGKGLLEGAVSDLKTLCERWIGRSYEAQPADTAWDIAERCYAAHLKSCLICQTISEFCKRTRVKQEKRWLTLKSQKAQARSGGHIWFWKAKPGNHGLGEVPEGAAVTVYAVDRSKPVFVVKVWSRASLVAKMKTNPDDLLVKKIEMLMLAREHEVPEGEWANVVAEGERLLEAEAAQ